MTLTETPGAGTPAPTPEGVGFAHPTGHRFMVGVPGTANPLQGQGFDAEEARRFLKLLGMDPATAWFRSITPGGKTNTRRRGRDLAGFDPEELTADIAAGAGLYLISGDAVAATGVNRKTGKPTACVQDADITACRALFAEWDDKPIEWQLTAWRDLGLPEPTLQNFTGGKSIHNWWVLDQAIDPQLWREITARLIAHCQSDKSCKNPSRLMRLPGSVYYDKKTGEAIGMAKIVGGSGNRVSLASILAALPPEAPTVPPGAPQAEQRYSTRPVAGDLPPRDLDAIRAAAQHIPKRVVGGGNYDPSRHALCGCSAAIAATGESEADAMALDLLAHLWPSRATAKQVLDSSTTRDPAAFWAIAGENGYDLRRQGLGKPNSPAGSDLAAAGDGRLTTADVTEALKNGISEGLSGSEYVGLQIDLAQKSGLSNSAIRQLAATVQQEADTTAGIQQEAAAIRADTDRRDIGTMLTFDYLLPPSIADALRVRCLALPADSVAATMAYLVALSGVAKLGTSVVASQVAEYKVPLNLYGGLVAISGAKKSPTTKILVKFPTQKLRDDLIREHNRAMREWHEQNHGVPPKDRPDPPRAVHLDVSDFTAEALAEQLQIQEQRGMGLLIHRDELAALFGSMNQYRRGKGGDSEQLLEAYDGTGFSSLRVASSDGGRFYERCHLSIWGTIQPAVLKSLVSDGDPSGLWARFIFVPLPEKVVPLADNETDADQRAAKNAAAVLADAADAIYRLPPAALQLSSDARTAFNRFEARCQAEAIRAHLPAQSALHGKAAGKALRIAGLLHLIQQVALDGTVTASITANTMERSIALIDHLNGWALGLHSEIATGGANPLMRTVHKAALAAQGPVRWKEISPRLAKSERKSIDSAAVAVAMEALEALGVGTTERGTRGALAYTATAPLP